MTRTLHVGLRVFDLERSLAFFTGLGYAVLGQVPGTEFGTLTMLKLPPGSSWSSGRRGTLTA